MDQRQGQGALEKEGVGGAQEGPRMPVARSTWFQKPPACRLRLDLRWAVRAAEEGDPRAPGHCSSQGHSWSAEGPFTAPGPAHEGLRSVISFKNWFRLSWGRGASRGAGHPHGWLTGAWCGQDDRSSTKSGG